VGQYDVPVTRYWRIAALLASVGIAAATGISVARPAGHVHSPAAAIRSASASASSPAPALFEPSYGPSGAKFEPPDGRVYLGVSTDIDRLGVFERAAGITTHPAIYNQYTRPDGPFSPTLANAASVPGMTPMVSWNLPLTDGAVVSGARDDYLRAQARVVKAFDKPVFIRPDWEMNSTWSPGWDPPLVPPSAYIAAWRHVYEVFQSEGVLNAAFVWCVNTWPGPDHTDTSAWYPGDMFVDWIGVDGYPQSASTDYLMDSQDGLNPLASFAAAHRKPLMLAEWAPDLPKPDTAAAMDLIFDWAAAHPRTVKALVYFDFTVGAKDFTLLDHPGGAAEFRRRTASGPEYPDTVPGAR